MNKLVEQKAFIFINSVRVKSTDKFSFKVCVTFCFICETKNAVGTIMNALK